MNIHSLYAPLLRRFRPSRMQRFRESCHVRSNTWVVDIGGTLMNWTLLEGRPRVTMVNLRASDGVRMAESMDLVLGDGRRLPFRDNAFDVAFSNSVIEHLGTADSQRLFAAECRRVATRYFVQAPARTFPFEPHYLTPCIHWLPADIQERVVRNFTVWGWITRPSRAACRRMVRGIRLLSEKEMRSFFPDAQIKRERFLGLTKSLIAIKA